MKIKNTGSSIEFDLPEPLSVWASSVKGDKLSLAARLLADCELLQIPAISENIHIPYRLVAAWPESIAVSAELPRNSPFGFDLRLSSGLGQTGTTLSVRWLKPSTSVPLSHVPNVDGAIISLGEHSFRIQDPYFTVLEFVKEFN